MCENILQIDNYLNRKIRITIGAIEQKFVGNWLINRTDIPTDATIDNIKKIIETEKSITDLYELKANTKGIEHV